MIRVLLALALLTVPAAAAEYRLVGLLCEGETCRVVRSAPTGQFACQGRLAKLAEIEVQGLRDLRCEASEPSRT